MDVRRLASKIVAVEIEAIRANAQHSGHSVNGNCGVRRVSIGSAIGGVGWGGLGAKGFEEGVGMGEIVHLLTVKY